MEAFPFQSNFLGFDEAGNPKYDRAVGAEFMRDREKLFYTNGIFALITCSLANLSPARERLNSSMVSIGRLPYDKINEL